jgi:hypothetical protein
MPEAAASKLQSDAQALESAADQAIAACGGDAREAVKALLIANEFLEREMEERVEPQPVRPLPADSPTSSTRSLLQPALSQSRARPCERCVAHAGASGKGSNQTR